jgi:uncharacterized membrane protein
VTLEAVLGWVLRVGVGLAALVSAVGLGLFLSGGSGLPLMRLGLIILVATPMARVVFSALAFAVGRDHLFLAMTLVVLALLVIGFVG